MLNYNLLLNHNDSQTYTIQGYMRHDSANRHHQGSNRCIWEVFQTIYGYMRHDSANRHHQGSNRCIWEVFQTIYGYIKLRRKTEEKI
jgi:hypothetical protein